MKRLALILVLAGCTMQDAPPAVTPAAAVLYRDTVTVQTSDGALCTGPRNRPGNTWSGTLQGCPHTWPYRVIRNTPRPRLPLAPGTGGTSGVTLETPAGPQPFSG